MENEKKSGRLPDAELNKLLNRRDMLRTQRNRMVYGLSLGAVLLFLGIGGMKVPLLFAGGLVVAVGLYFLLRVESQYRELYAILRENFPDGVPDRPPKQAKRTSWKDSFRF